MKSSLMKLNHVSTFSGEGQGENVKKTPWGIRKIADDCKRGSVTGLCHVIWGLSY